MVLNVFVEGCNESMNVRNVGFTKFICEILRGWNLELGRLYEEKYGYSWDDNTELGILKYALMLTRKEETNQLTEKIKKILDEYDKPYNEGMKIFAYHSDCEGEISPKECTLVLKEFQRVNTDNFDKSDDETYEWIKENYDIWITMLKYSIENDKPIIFG